MLRWNDEALFALAGLVFGCSGSAPGQASVTQIGGSTASCITSGGATSGGGSTSLGTNVDTKPSGGTSGAGGANGMAGTVALAGGSGLVTSCPLKGDAVG